MARTKRSVATKRKAGKDSSPPAKKSKAIPIDSEALDAFKNVGLYDDSDLQEESKSKPKPKPSKSMGVAQLRAYLGAFLDYTRFLATGKIRVMPKWSSRQTTCQAIEQARAEGSMAGAQTSKVRGKANWVASNSLGRLGRVGARVLKAIQEVGQ